MSAPFLRLLLLALVATACGGAPGAEPRTALETGSPSMSASFDVPADSLYATVHQRLVDRGYRIDQTDARKRRMMVRAPGDETRVEVRVVSKKGRSEVEVAPRGQVGAIEAMTALITVTHDATIDPDPASPPR